ncbi:MAG TPA: Na+/H+ antiporter [Thermoleophilaceae bacterium]|nr:Na+/H+ antiporter [Thermoleophilaceae bacterium]
MTDVQTLLVLVAVAVVLVRVADAMHVPSPIVLVLGGLAIALAPGLPQIELPPEAIFFGFLPPLVHSAGWWSSPRELRAVVRPLTLLCVGLVFATAAAVALVAHELVPGLGWAPAAILGAILAPTDAVSAVATFGQLGIPERTRLLVEGESMINDAVALVLWRIAIGAATGGALSAGDAVLTFLGNSLGGVAVGLAAGWLSAAIMRRQTDAPLVIFVGVVTAYAAYIGADALHASGILAAVVAGLYAGYQAPRVLDADTRLTGIAFWRVLVFGLEVTLFVLLGLQLPAVVDALAESSLSVGELIGPAVAIAAVSIAVRLVFVLAMGADAGEDVRERLLLGWSGMRGAVSLAAALAVPHDVEGRPAIVFLTFTLILATLVGQGLTLPLVVRALGLRRERRWSDEEAVARMEAAQAALDRLDELEEEDAIGEAPLRRLRDLYRARFRVCAAVLGGSDTAAAIRDEQIGDYRRLRRDLIGTERETLRLLRAEGRLTAATMRMVEYDLDLEEARLRA